MGCIYAITCSDRYYIGSTKNFHKRMAEHRSDLQRGKHKNTYMQRVYDKYGGFEYKILESVEDEKLVDREQVHIDRHYGDVKCMNASPHAHRAYNPWTEESRAKMSATCTGRKHTDETKKKMSDVKKGTVSNNAKSFTFLWNDKSFHFDTPTQFYEMFTESARCLFRLAKGKRYVVGNRKHKSAKHPFISGDVVEIVFD